MGDSSDSLEIIPAILKFHEESSTLVSPSRYMPGEVQIGGELLKKTLSMLAGKSLNILGLLTSDTTNNFKLYDGAWLRSPNIESVGGFEVALELCYKSFSQGKKITQLPKTWRDRT